MKTTVLIQGIGLIYHKNDNLWKVIFPFGECHTVIFKENPKDPGISLAGVAKNVRIKAVNPTSSFETGRFDDVLNLTSDRAHKDGVNLKDNPEPFVLLIIENASFSIKHHTFCKYNLVDASGPIAQAMEIAYTAEAVIESDAIIIEADGVPGFPKTFNSDIDLTFNNECPDGSSGSVSDLKLLYGVIKDARNNGLEFTLDRDPQQKPNAIDTPFTGLTNRDNNLLPGQEGLPCNVSKVTKPGNLP